MKCITYRFITHRDQIGEWLTENGWSHRPVVEIGVAHGGFARIVLSKFTPSVYYMIDLWRQQPAHVYREKHHDIDYEQKMRECLQLARLRPEVQLIREDSVIAAQLFEDASLDWIYIDANHAREAVLADMNAWFPKLRPGGLFSGHDYEVRINDHDFIEVKPAVDEWMEAHNREFVVTDCLSWWMFK